MLKILLLYPFKSIEQPEFDSRHRDTNSYNVSIYKFEDLVGSATCGTNSDLFKYFWPGRIYR